MTTAAACAVAFGLTWLMGWLISSDMLDLLWSRHYPLLGAAFFVGLICTALWARQLMRHQQSAQRYFQALVTLDQEHLADGTLAADLPQLEPDNPWREPAGRFVELLRHQAERLAQTEHERATMDVRVKRNVARQSQIESILAGLPEAVLAVDSYDEIILANPAAEQLLDFNLLSASDRAASHLIHCQTLLDLISEMRRRRGASQRTIELELADAQGQPRWFGVTAKTYSLCEGRNDDGSAGNGIFVALRDITALKSSQKRNAEFVSAVSHEMKTPLAGIKAYVELLADGEAQDEATREEFLNVINSQANRLQRLIDNLLNLARIEAGVVQVSKESNSLNEILSEAIDIVRPSAQAKQIDLTSELSTMFLGVHADRDMLTQAAINLLSNAVKYTPAGGSVTLRSRLDDQEAVFEVEDTGVGLSEEDRRRIFEKFYRVKKDREMASGTGLGLPLAKHIVEDVHGGHLTVDSELGKGSTFRVALPVAAQVACHV